MWNPKPHMVDIKCPNCNEKAKYEFAEVVRIELREDIPFFENSSVFEYQLFTDSCGHKWHGAVYYAGLHGRGVKAITELPDGYESNNWQHSKYLIRNHGAGIGSYSCNSCNSNVKHALNWPNDAYYSVEYKGESLWAFNSESLHDLIGYLDGDERKADDYKWRNFLLHIPTKFKTKKARETVVKKLEKLL